MVESGNNISILIVRKNGSVNEFHGVTDISFQMRGVEFPVIQGLEKPKLLHTGTCSVNQHAACDFNIS